MMLHESYIDQYNLKTKFLDIQRSVVVNSIPGFLQNFNKKLYVHTNKPENGSNNQGWK